MRIVADLSFAVRIVQGGTRSRGTPITGRVEADGSIITVSFSRPPSLLGTSGRRTAGVVADALDRSGITVRVLAPSGLLVAVGHEVDAPWWQVLATGSKRIRLGSARTLAESLRGPQLFDAALPGSRIRASPGRRRRMSSKAVSPKAA